MNIPGKTVKKSFQGYEQYSQEDIAETGLLIIWLPEKYL